MEQNNRVPMYGMTDEGKRATDKYLASVNPPARSSNRLLVMKSRAKKLSQKGKL